MYKNLDDNEIIYMINDSDDYIEIMLDKYKPFINKICRKYLNLAQKVGIELDDLIQIANISLINAIKYYDNNLKTTFYTYINKCIENNLLTEIRKELSNKKKSLNSSLSLDEIIPGTDKTLLDIIEDDKVLDPSDYLIIEEQEIEYTKFINSLPFEVAIVYEMKINGFSNDEISKFLGIDKMSIRKSMQYVRNRLCLN